MIETNYAKRHESALQKIARRNEVVRTVFSERDITVLGERKELGGWNAEYKVSYQGRTFIVADTATIPVDRLADNIREQLDASIAAER